MWIFLSISIPVGTHTCRWCLYVYGEDTWMLWAFFLLSTSSIDTESFIKTEIFVISANQLNQSFPWSHFWASDLAGFYVRVGGLCGLILCSNRIIHWVISPALSLWFLNHRERLLESLHFQSPKSIHVFPLEFDYNWHLHILKVIRWCEGLALEEKTAFYSLGIASLYSQFT